MDWKLGEVCLNEKRNVWRTSLYMPLTKDLDQRAEYACTDILGVSSTAIEATPAAIRTTFCGVTKSM